jgi:hypothetical protein
MQSFKIIVDTDVSVDIKEIVGWYNQHGEHLGPRFKKTVKDQIKTLRFSATSYMIRYKEIRCMPLNDFPFMVHFAVDESKKSAIVLAIIHTSRNPDIWEEKTKNI